MDKLPWRILLIDDDQDDYLLIRTMLASSQGRKCHLNWVSSYAEGWESLNNTLYDAVLVDYDLGQHTGLDLIREAVQCGYQAPIILYTGRGSYEVDVEALQAGATLYLSKGETNPLLLERSIRYAIERKQTEQALAHANEMLRAHQGDLHRQKAQLQQQNLLLQEEIAERKRAEEALTANEATLRGVLDATKESIWLFAPDGTILICNETALLRFKKQAEEMIGKNFRQFVPFEMAATRQARLDEVVETRKPVRFEDERAGISFLHNFYPVFDSDGNVASIAAFSRDVTEVKHKEAEILQYMEELKSKNDELTRFNNAMVGRELRMIELKREINELCAQLSLPPRYSPASEKEGV